MQSILELARDENLWNEFLKYKLEHQHLNRHEEKEIRDFIANKSFLSVCDLWAQGNFPSCLATKKQVNKQGTKKKRTVYTYPGDEGMMLKFIAFHLFRYDEKFCNNCYAFRRQFGVREAILRIRNNPSIKNKYCLKVDISNYFNSIDVSMLMSMLDFVRDSDPLLYQVFERILTETHVMEDNRIVPDEHGAMAGTPISPFFANVYLSAVDKYYADNGILYFRYSDDILIFADSMEELTKLQDELYSKISDLKLSINPNKVCIAKPGEAWEFLGFGYHNGEIDLSEATIRKMKAKIKRKSDALRRWQQKKGLSSDKAAIGLIRAMNNKFYGKNWNEHEEEDESEDSNDFTWSRWFFPNLTTDAGLKIIDQYLQEYIRYTVTGRHYKGNYRIKYETLKEWGYRSLVHEYYKL
ncbi:MAG: group II intron reverse transcriptase domain-containing protein [Lachnospiraceae bacterium]|nr:group II intron reverse transcriptase domain-containing protein [Lachnospiraceae bacterium]